MSEKKNQIKYVKIKNFDEACYNLENSKYEKTALNFHYCYRINGFNLIPIPRNQSFLIFGEQRNLESFLEKINAEILENKNN